MAGYWWCENCKEEVGGYHVTSSEMHEVCGHPVVVIEAGDQLDMMRTQLAAREAELAQAQGEIARLKRVACEQEVAIDAAEKRALKAELEIDRLTKGGCGLPGHTTATGDEGTCYCLTCEQAARLDERKAEKRGAKRQ